MTCEVCLSRRLVTDGRPADVQAYLPLPKLCPKHFAELGFAYENLLGIRVADSFLQQAKQSLKDERDGKGGARSNRNVDCERMLYRALAAYDAAKKGEADG